MCRVPRGVGGAHAAATLPAQRGVPRTRRPPTRGWGDRRPREAVHCPAPSSAGLSWNLVGLCARKDLVRERATGTLTLPQGQGAQSCSASGQLGHLGQPARAGVTAQALASRGLAQPGRSAHARVLTRRPRLFSGRTRSRAVRPIRAPDAAPILGPSCQPPMPSSRAVPHPDPRVLPCAVP